ncbi:MAG: aldo/keto reductase [Chloroflexi bacterium]|jgi:aryl-alcohol dehydrogenase-like predicted oxidoreductase|nr:aldo/keto reductase [Chloroflexota bacterium]MBT4072076.1 aldo/keto reductase [Chloroflexota bacterium]MBT4514251.1 aldo/keto reductase [Chloroflexota bacterium]MBT5319452.1 aldo/keto reductase [Chloroflexota bacterium]MBT6682445.1 aldo/keto reductase [Chloroflexota bacterium]
METTALGKTGLEITRLGIGLSEIGSILSAEDEKTASDVLNSALDNGINFLDTAACYGLSEEFIGKAIPTRRDEYVLASKAGHYVPRGEGEDWTYDLVTESIERSLTLMKTDHLDLIQLHSCVVEVLEKGDVIRAIQDAKQAGKVNHIGYSGDNENAKWAVDSGLFETLQTSYSLVDQGARANLFPGVVEQGMGLIIKRPIGNAVWGRATDPNPYWHMPSSYTEEYFRRGVEMAKAGPVEDAPDNDIELAMGFTLSRPEVSTVIVGTLNPRHLESNVQMAGGGLSISDAAIADLERRYDAIGSDWEQRG